MLVVCVVYRVATYFIQRKKKRKPFINIISDFKASR